MKARKKPITIDVWQSQDLFLADDLPDWVAKAIEKHYFGIWPSYGGDFYVDTLEGRMTFYKGDYLVRGVYGELYAINKVIFEKTYDIVAE